MRSRVGRWWQSRFAIYVGIIVLILVALFDLKFRSRNFVSHVSMSASSQPSAPPLDWHDRRNWRANLSVGMPETKVRTIFGPPQKVSVSNFRETWVYGSGEIIFADGTVYNWTEPDPLD
jgi:hypothetical protein